MGEWQDWTEERLPKEWTADYYKNRCLSIQQLWRLVVEEVKRVPGYWWDKDLGKGMHWERSPPCDTAGDK